MADSRYKIHWAPNFTDAEVRDIKDRNALITGAEYKTQPEEGLHLTLKNREENLEGKILVNSANPFGLSEEEIRLEARKAADDVYASFEVPSPEHLVGKKVVAKIFRGSVIGIQRGY